MLKKPYFIFLSLLLLLFACNSNPWKVDTDEIDLTIDWNRFDLELYERSKATFNNEQWIDMQESFPEFTALYVEKIMRFGSVDKAETFNTMRRFLSDEDMKTLLSDVAEKFKEGDLESQRNELTKAFKRYHYHFPERSIPAIRTFISAFTYSTVAAEGLLGVGLEMYMGSDYELYSKIGIPKYKSKNFELESLTADAVKAWLISEFEIGSGKNLLENMIFNGKILYLTKALLPDEAAHHYFKYSYEDLEWCEKNEKEIWYHFVDMELLHTDDTYKIRKYLGEAPFISGFPEGSPGRVGEWIGFRIVEAYMKNNENLTLVDLMDELNADKILQQSKYKPKR